MPAKSPFPLLLIVLLIALLVVPTTAAAEMIDETVEGDTHIITIYDEAPPIARVFDKPSPTTVAMRVKGYVNSSENGITQMVIHRDIGDLDHIIFGSHRVVPSGYNFVDEVPITVYWDPTQQVGGFPPHFNGTYVGSGTMYAYSNSETQEGHLTFLFDNWDSSIYQQHDDIRIFCWIDAPRPLKFSTIAMGTRYGTVTQIKPLNDDVVCSIYGIAGDSWDFRYGNSTHVYTKGQTFEQRIEYSNTTPEIVNLVIHRIVEGEFYQSTIKIFSPQYSDPYLTDDSVKDLVEVQLPRSEAPFTLEIYSPVTNKTYTTTIYGDSPTPTDPDDPDDPDGSGITVYIKNSQTGALIANANVAIDALEDGEYYPVTNRTEPSGIFSINLQPTGGGKPNPDGYRLIATADGYNNPMPEINFTLGDYRKYFECFLDPIAGRTSGRK